MIWQDTVLTGCLISFAIALIPTLRSNDKPPAKSSFMTAITLLGFVSVHASYELWFGVAMQLLVASQWLIIGIQKVRQNKAAKERKDPWET